MMKRLPDRLGHFGEFGGRFVPDTLFAALEDLEKIYRSVSKEAGFKRELASLLSDYVGRPTPLFFAQTLSDELGLRVYLKREDLNHTGAHKINNTMGQILLAKRMGKTRIIAETGAGQHGVATATVCALMGMTCSVYMGEEDMKRQALNVARMKLLGAEVIPVTSGSRTLKDATTEAIRDWLGSVETTYYIIGSVVGPHPYPMMVRDFQSVIGKESRKQILNIEGKLPNCVVACVGGGSNSMGMFHAFLNDSEVALLAVEAAGHGLDSGQHSASLFKGSPGVLHGALSYLLQDDDGQIELAHSISAGLDYPGVGPELSYLKKMGRLSMDSATDDEALEACQWVAKTQGIIVALETAHAFAALKKYKRTGSGDVVVVCVSGRGDKDMETIAKHVFG
jgi:tryptophan synthase beta chain